MTELAGNLCMFKGQTIYQCYGTLLNVTNNITELYSPLTTRHKVVVSGCKSRTPRTLMKRRSVACNKLLKARTDYGPNGDLTALAWRENSFINIEYGNFSISRKCEIEINLICNQSDKP